MKDVLNWEIMAGGITPNAQPLGVPVNKVFKGYVRNYFKEWLPNASLNEKNGNPLLPSWQLLAKWVVLAWEKVSPALTAKAWEVCGYTTQKDLQADADIMRALNVWTHDSIWAVDEHAAGKDASTHFLHDIENMPEPMFVEDGEEDEWDGYGYGNGCTQGEKKRACRRGSGPAAGRKRLKSQGGRRPQAKDTSC